MRRLCQLAVVIVAALLCSHAHAQCATLSSPSQSALQSALNSCGSGNTLQLNAGSTTVTSSLTLPCGVVLQGPTATPATAKITTTTANISLFVADNCTGAASTGFQYLQFDGAGAFHTNGSSFSNFVFKNNQVTNLHSEYCGAGCNQPCVSCQSIYFNFNSGITLQNLDIEFNSFGDSNSCTASAGFVPFTVTSDNFPGNCAGLIIASQNHGAVVNLTLQYNTFFHLEEAFHMLNVSFNGGQPTSYCNNCLIQYNYLSSIRRIQFEYQAQIFSNPLRFRYNVLGPPDYSSANAGQYAFSLPCCQFGQTFGTATNTFIDTSSNIIYDPNPTTSSTNGISWGAEAWGYGSNYSNNLIQGYVCVGLNWGIVDTASQFSHNTMQGSVMAGGACTFAGGTGGFIGQEFPGAPPGQGNVPPTQTGNVFSATPGAITSVAPSISPSPGTHSYPLTVTLTDAGYTSGSQPLANTGIWYTTDGSTPVPGSGTAKRVDSGGTFLLMGPATVQAVGMWGAANQPTSYPSGFGFTPSSVVSAAYTTGGAVTLTGATIAPTAGVSTLTIGGTVQMITICHYSDGSTTGCNTSDTHGNAVTSWASNSGNATVSSSGLATGAAVGTATITATVTGGTQTVPGAVLTVNASPLTLGSIALATTGGVSTIPAGTTNQLLTTCHYNDGTTAPCNSMDSHGNAVTSANSSAPSIASVTSPGSLVTGITGGSTNLTTTVTPTPSILGTSLENVTGATGLNFINEIYGVTGTSASGYTPGDCHIIIPATTNWTAGKLWTCLLVLGTPTTQNAAALCSNSYTMTGTSWPGGDIVISMAACPSLPPDQGYWVGSTTSQTTASPVQGFSNCGGNCSGGPPVFGSGTYSYSYVANPFGNYTALPTTPNQTGTTPGLQVSQYILLTTTPVTSNTVPLTVNSASPTLLSAYITGTNSLTVGGTAQLAAKCHYTSGPDQDCTVADIYGDKVTLWLSDALPDATVSPSGLVAALSSTALCSGVGRVCTPVSSPPVASMVSITAFGCTSGGADCTSGINSAISSAASAGKAVYIPCGTFTHSAFSDNGVSIYGAGSCSILYAPTANNVEITMSGSGWTLANFVTHAASSTRDSLNWNIFNNGSTNFRVDNLEIWGGNAGGLINYNTASGGIITNNYVHDTLADGIYSTYGSNTLIVANTQARNAGDDSISNVGYGADGPSKMPNNILDQNNDVGFQSNGRGISVVGAANVTIKGNLVQNTTQNACIYLADEPSYNSDAVSNVIVTGNTAILCSGSTGQPGILAYAGQGSPGVTGVSISGNTVSNAVHDAAGINPTGGTITNLAFTSNTFTTPGGTGLVNQGAAGTNIYCNLNTLNGSPTAPGSVCNGTNTFTPTGSSLTWTGNVASSGAANITAVINNAMNSAAFPITVTNPVVTLTGVSLSLTGGVTGLFVGATNQLKATCTYSDGSHDDCTTTDAHGNLAHNYASTTPAHATVNATNGLVTGVAPGATTFTAVAGSFTSNALPLNVFPVLSGVYTITVSGPVKFSGTVQF